MVFGVLQLFNKEHKEEFNSDDKGVVYLLCGVAGNVFRFDAPLIIQQ